MVLETPWFYLFIYLFVEFFYITVLEAFNNGLGLRILLDARKFTCSRVNIYEYINKEAYAKLLTVSIRLYWRDFSPKRGHLEWYVE